MPRREAGAGWSDASFPARASRRAASLAGHVSPPPLALSRSPCSASPRAPPALAVHPEVAAALASNRAVVALESTIVSHGMPYPRNLEMAREVEAIVRARGAVPATIAVMDGVPTVGLADAQLEALAKLGSAAMKVSRRDLAHCVASSRTGATTVSATACLAAKAGVGVFVTGGVGGVHRGAERTMDVSADLIELGKTPVAVICAGAKSVLDIPKTLEYLETQGVPVAAYGADDFPAFFARSSGERASARVDDPVAAARLIRAGRTLGLEQGALIAVPIPAEHEAKGAEVEAAIRRALDECESRGVRGRDVTPFLLERVRVLTDGASLDANVALVKNNARVGADIAVELARIS